MRVNHMISFCLIVLMLAGCGQVRDQLGLNRHSPDEFTVIKRAPLTLPPDYNLRAPSTNTELITSTVTTETKQALFGNTSAKTVSSDDADNAFLNQIGTSDINSDIRNDINRDNGFVDVKEKSTLEKIFRGDQSNDIDSIVDAKAEADRISEATENGDALTGDDTPVIEDKKTVLDKLF